jgi:hypothetical protein
MERLKRFTASSRQGYRVPRRARVYFPMLGPSASAPNMPSLKLHGEGRIFVRFHQCPPSGVQSGGRILDPIRHAHGVSYCPRWFELPFRLAVAAGRACRRKILKARAKSRANQLTQRGWSARRSAHKRILAHSPYPRRFSAAQNVLRIFAGAFRKAQRNLPRPSRRYNSTCRQ